MLLPPPARRRLDMATFAHPLERWQHRFDIEGYLFGERPNTYLADQQRHLQPGSALSVADGEGRNSVWLAKQGLQVDAFDFSSNAVHKAHRLAASHQVQVNFHCCDWQSYHWPQAHYDNVVGIFFQFAGPDPRAQLFAHMDRCLKPGGLLVIQGYSTAQLRFNTGGPGELDHLYDEALMRASFPDYEVLDLRTYEAEVAEGTAHNGMSGLLGFVGRKPMA
jgi:cyclopropane fatty-acyl-phospholipid synthase-like methyltransferase